jgi:hypothetical protein
MNKIKKQNKIKDKIKDKKKDKKKEIKTKKQNGGDIISASTDVVKSMVDLGKSIFTSIDSIVNIGSQIDSVSKQTALPTVQGPPQFNRPNI